MSLNNKLARVFQMGFAQGVKSTRCDWNAEVYLDTEEGKEPWERRYRMELDIALAEFLEHLRTERV